MPNHVLMILVIKKLRCTSFGDVHKQNEQDDGWRITDIDANFGLIFENDCIYII